MLIVFSALRVVFRAMPELAYYMYYHLYTMFTCLAFQMSFSTYIDYMICIVNVHICLPSVAGSSVRFRLTSESLWFPTSLVLFVDPLRDAVSD